MARRPLTLDPWFVRGPGKLEEIRDYLRTEHPNLHAFAASSAVEIRGTFPIRGPDGELIDEYQVSIELKADYPETLPVVFELAGRIPRTQDRHMFSDGSACVVHPDDRWRCFPEEAPFCQYVEGPLYNFFLSQTVFEETGEWPFGDWGHGDSGTKEYYFELLGIEDLQVVSLFLRELSLAKLRAYRPCPCRSGRPIGACCLAKLEALHGKLPRSQARRRAGEFEQWYLADNRRAAPRGNKVPRNSPCPCGSGVKHKKCCLSQSVSDRN